MAAAHCSASFSQMSFTRVAVSSNYCTSSNLLGSSSSCVPSRIIPSLSVKIVSSSMSSSMIHSPAVDSASKTSPSRAVSNVSTAWASGGGGASSKLVSSMNTIVPVSSRREWMCSAQTDSLPPMSEAEKEGWEQRQKEAAEAKDASPFQWQWTLNWNEITPNIVVGSCPRSPGDVDRMVDEAGIDAVLNLQSDLCFDALKIPFDSIRTRAVERGILLERVAIRDFDHGDQSLMLPVAVRMLNMLVARGMKVYVHCTAGINRATLTTVGHLTFVQGMELDDAVRFVKSARPIAHPYIDCWNEVRRRLLDGRTEEITGTSESMYEARLENGSPGTPLLDWGQAEKIVVSRTFQRWLETDLAMIDMETAWLRRRFELANKVDAADTNGSTTAY